MKVFAVALCTYSAIGKRKQLFNITFFAVSHELLIQVNSDEIPVVIVLSVQLMTHSLIDIFAL